MLVSPREPSYPTPVSPVPTGAGAERISSEPTGMKLEPSLNGSSKDSKTDRDSMSTQESLRNPVASTSYSLVEPVKKANESFSDKYRLDMESGVQQTASPLSDLFKDDVKQSPHSALSSPSEPSSRYSASVLRKRRGSSDSTPNLSAVPDDTPLDNSDFDPNSVKAEDSDPSTPKAAEDIPTTNSKKKLKAKKEEVIPQLISDLAVANEEALRSFVEIPDCTYANKSLGNTPYYDADGTTCDCTYDKDWASSEQACGEHAQCMNRLMQIECVSGDCKCRRHCQNQRFQNKEYAPIEVVRTEKKGYGVRARTNMTADTFVYEYIGEVIGPTVFAKKMKEYGQEGIRHFYFMALDKEVFIDATKKGGKARFLNHSCNPNCMVAKWTVGSKMRMGIFTKRDILKDEELTFNYNVDRYGHQAQECFCGEPNCVGFIGGKTQTDIGGMDDLYLDALGIAEEVEALGLRGTKKKKGKKLDEDFMPLMRPIQIDEVPKVSAAVRQAITTRRILEKLLTRIEITSDAEVQRELLRLHGFNLMSHILKEYPDDLRIVFLDLKILNMWPLLARNKVESSGIEESVIKCTEMADEEIVALAQNLLKNWSELELGYRIPKSAREAGDEERKRTEHFSIEHIAKRARVEEFSSNDEPNRPVFVKPEASVVRAVSPPLPPGWKIHTDKATDKPYYYNSELGKTTWDKPKLIVGKDGPPPTPPPAVRSSSTTFDVGNILAKAQAEAAAQAAKMTALMDAEIKREEEQAKALKAARKAKKLKSSPANKDKRVMVLFSPIVVQVMSKYKAHLDSEQFKKRARELTSLLCEKEKKHPMYSTEPYEKLSPEKAAKVKAFVKDWVKKLIERKHKSSSSSSRHRSLSVSSSSTAVTSTSDSTELTIPSPSIPLSPEKRISTFNGGAADHGESAQEDADLIAAMVAEAHGIEDDEDEEEDSKDDHVTASSPVPPPPPAPHVKLNGHHESILEAKI